MQPEKALNSKKVLSRQSLADSVQRLKQEGKTIVSTNGSFDLLHFGHVTMLQEAKSLGDVLIVGLNSDAGIRRYKGKYRPICPEAQRVGMLAALACVDYITVFDELTPIELLRVIQPHIHVNSPEHGKACVEREVVEQHGGRIHLAQLVAGMSTTQLIGRIQESLAHPPAYAIFINTESLLLPFDDIETKEQLREELHSLLARLGLQNFQLFIFSRSAATERLNLVRELLLPESHESKITFCHNKQSPKELIEQLANERDLVLAKSVIISHDLRDIQVGRVLNSKTLLLIHRQSPAEKSSENTAHLTARSLRELPELLQQL